MIEVRIGYASTGTSRRLCDWPATELDRLIPMIEAWGVAGELATDCYGQFRVDDTDAYFEVLINDEEDESGAGA